MVGWPDGLRAYFQTGRFVACGGAWAVRVDRSDGDEDTTIATILKRCEAIAAPIPKGSATWPDMLGLLREHLLVMHKSQANVGT
jgi:hypothetical protein